MANQWDKLYWQTLFWRFFLILCVLLLYFSLQEWHQCLPNNKWQENKLLQLLPQLLLESNVKDKGYRNQRHQHRYQPLFVNSQDVHLTRKLPHLRHRKLFSTSLVSIPGQQLLSIVFLHLLRVTSETVQCLPPCLRHPLSHRHCHLSLLSRRRTCKSPLRSESRKGLHIPVSFAIKHFPDCHTSSVMNR